MDGATLARAAWNAIKLPTPTVETNPKVGSQGATLVGMDTWVWATGSTPKTVTATATAGPTTATVTASSAGLQLSAPDGKASCQGFGVAWHSGMPEGSSPCTISFNRSSAHLGGTTPLTVSVAYRRPPRRRGPDPHHQREKPPPELSQARVSKTASPCQCTHVLAGTFLNGDKRSSLASPRTRTCTDCRRTTSAIWGAIDDAATSPGTVTLL